MVPAPSALQPIERLKLTEAFRAVSRRGRWARGVLLSLGALPNQQDRTRLGLRVRKLVGNAVQRNRLKRQLRVSTKRLERHVKPGFDVVVVPGPQAALVSSDELTRELESLCKRAGILWQPPRADR